MFVKSIRCIFFSVLIGTSGMAVAQRDTTLSQEVEVIKSYKPTIADANKISNMPRIEDAPQEKPVFNYSIFSQPIYNTFSVNTLKAATHVSEPVSDTGYGLLRAGVGNYNRPYGELFFNSQKTRNTMFGLHGRHLSSHSKLKLEGGDRVDAPFSDNEAEFFLKHLFRNSILSLNLGFDHNGFNYYGYPIDPVPDSLKVEDQNTNYFGSRQTFTKGSFNINLENVASSRNEMAFDFDFLYHYFGTKTGQREHYGKFITDIRKPGNEGTAFVKTGFIFVDARNITEDYMLSFGRGEVEPAQNRQTVFTFQPAYRIGGEVANLRLGLKSWFVFDSSDDFKARLAPDIRANLVPLKDIINIYAGIDGNFIHNHYSKIAYENPFVDPEHLVKNSMEKFRFYGGFDGKLAAKTNFKLSADYSIMGDNPLYYLYRQTLPTGESIVDNDFDVFYDNFNRLKLNLELFHVAYDKMDMLLSANYYIYKMETMEEPWNLPPWEAKLSFGYKVSEQLNVSADMFFTGNRKGLILSMPSGFERPVLHSELLLSDELQWESYNLSAVVDLNLNATYKFTSRLAAFAKLNNFGFQQYQRWLGYPVQSFNIMGGISFSF